jgi:cytidine deaminase
MPERITFDVFLEEYENISQLPVDCQTLIKQARKTCKYAYAPYSNFLVGAALLMENGEVVTGSNQENASSPNGLCAERVALYSAAARFPSVGIRKLAISAIRKEGDTYLAVTPCGSCRQVISEYQTIQQYPIQIIMEGPETSFLVAASIDMLLPFKFSAKNMESKNDQV